MVSKKRAIDANELLKYVGSKLGFMISKCELLQAIEVQPTIDAVEVVRCKDCKYCDTFYPRKEIGKEPEQSWYCKPYKHTCKPDSFCSDGERKANDDT